MALTVTTRSRRVTSTRLRVAAKVTFDSSYPTGGEPYTPDMFGLNGIDDLFVAGVTNDGTKLVVLDADNAKIKLLSALGVEVTNASSQTGSVVEVIAVGVGSP